MVPVILQLTLVIGNYHVLSSWGKLQFTPSSVAGCFSTCIRRAVSIGLTGCSLTPDKVMNEINEEVKKSSTEISLNFKRCTQVQGHLLSYLKLNEMFTQLKETLPKTEI